VDSSWRPAVTHDSWVSNSGKTPVLSDVFYGIFLVSRKHYKCRLTVDLTKRTLVYIHADYMYDG